MASKRLATAVGTALTALAMAGLISIDAQAASKGRLVAHKFVDASRGGYLRAPSGAAIRVPAGVMSEDGLVTITKIGRRVHDIHISVPWTGRVRITVPMTRRDSRVLHRVGGFWAAEGGRRVRTVSVTSLSPFTDWISTKAKKGRNWAKEKVATQLCLLGNKKKVVQCLIYKGVKQVSEALANWIARQLSESCAAAVFANGPIEFPVTIFNDPACIESASAPGVPQPPSTLPVGNNPGGSQTETVNPQQPPPPPPPPPPPAPPGPGPDPGVSPRGSNRMSMDQRLYAASADFLQSTDGRFKFVMQSDGNLVLYAPSGPIWTTSTVGRGANHLRMQGDGNLVMYNGANYAIWSSRTPRHYNAFLIVQNDGNVVIYNDGRAIWHTGTGGRT